VRVQVVYDEPAPLDDLEGVDVTRITRELTPKSPYELNLMRITVDGKPIDDPNRSSSDVQRCTDVALDDAKIQFRFDNLSSRPRLGVAVTRPPLPSLTSATGRSRRPCASSCTRTTRASSTTPRSRVRTRAVAAGAPLAIVAVDARGCRVAARAEQLADPRASSSSCCAPTTPRATSTRPSRTAVDQRRAAQRASESNRT
jgi:hypothetical protein